MTDRSESNARPWAEHLSLLYAEEVAADVSDRIASLLSRYRKVVERSEQTVLSECDVMLITYGDTLVDNGMPPLQVLHRFYREYLNEFVGLVHILPFHPYSSDDGFAVIDYYDVRDELGGWGDIQQLSMDCRVMADAVINHVSSESGWFRGFLAGRVEYAEFFVECDPAVDLSDVVRPRTSPLLTAYTDANGSERHIWTTFSADQVDLNYRNPDVLLAVLEVLFFLIRQGARLLRLDAVTYLWKEAGTTCANLPETHAIIKIIRGAVAALCPGVMIVTETNVLHRENVAYFGDGQDEAHMVYNFALPPLIAHSLIQGDSRRLSAWASDLRMPSEEVCLLNFSASHDGIGVRPVEEILSEHELLALIDAATAIGGSVSYRTIDGEDRPYELNCTFLDLISTPGEDDEITAARFVASQAIALAMPGVPAIYIHSLLGTRNDHSWVELTGRARSINRSRLDYAAVQDALRGDGLPLRIFRAMRRLIVARRNEPAFNPYGDFRILELGDEVFAIRRWLSGHGQDVVAIVNLTPNDVTITIDQTICGTDVLNGQDIRPGEIALASYAVLWIRCAGGS